MSLVLDVESIVAESDSDLLAKHETWSRVPLRDVAAILNGFPFDSKHFSKSSGTPLIRIRDIGTNATECRFDAPFDPRFLIERGSLLVGMDGDFKAEVWDGEPGLLNQRVCKVTANPEFLVPCFLAYVLPGYLRAIHGHTSSLTVKHLSSRSIAEIPLPLPTLDEQRRIVDRVDALLERVSRATGRLDRVPPILRRFRQAVLAAACSGALTHDWRQRNPGVDAPSLRGMGDSSSRIEETDPDETEPLPDSWVHCRVQDVADVRLGGTPSRKVPSYWNGSIAWVSSGEVANCRIANTRERITPEGMRNSNAKLYPRGTVLIAMIGEGKTRGQSAILDIEACTNQNAAGLIVDERLAEPEYVWLWALSQYETNREAGRGNNQPALNGARVRALPFPLPPLAEQRAIVRRVHEFLSAYARVEDRVTAALKAARNVSAGILAAAFTGELVPTEAELARIEGRAYETAEQLLARVGTQGALPDRSSRTRIRSATGRPRPGARRRQTGAD